MFHPLEALRAIRAGHAFDIMAVSYRPPKERGQPWGDGFEALMPRSTPAWNMQLDPHRRNDTYDALGVCIFLTKLQRCRIHASGFKPVECRRSMLCRPKGYQGMTDEERLAPWQTAVGRMVVDIWRRELANPQAAARCRIEQRKEANR